MDISGNILKYPDIAGLMLAEMPFEDLVDLMEKDVRWRKFVFNNAFYWENIMANLPGCCMCGPNSDCKKHYRIVINPDCVDRNCVCHLPAERNVLYFLHDIVVSKPKLFLLFMRHLRLNPKMLVGGGLNFPSRIIVSSDEVLRYCISVFKLRRCYFRKIRNVDLFIELLKEENEIDYAIDIASIYDKYDAVKDLLDIGCDKAFVSMLHGNSFRTECERFPAILYLDIALSRHPVFVINRVWNRMTLEEKSEHFSPYLKISDNEILKQIWPEDTYIEVNQTEPTDICQTKPNRNEINDEQVNPELLAVLRNNPAYAKLRVFLGNVEYANEDSLFALIKEGEFSIAEKLIDKGAKVDIDMIYGDITFASFLFIFKHLKGTDETALCNKIALMIIDRGYHQPFYPSFYDFLVKRIGKLELEAINEYVDENESE